MRKRTHQVHRAHGSSQQASHHGTDAANSNVAYYGSKERSHEDSAYGSFVIIAVLVGAIEHLVVHGAQSIRRSNTASDTLHLIVLNATS